MDGTPPQLCPWSPYVSIPPACWAHGLPELPVSKLRLADVILGRSGGLRGRKLGEKKQSEVKATCPCGPRQPRLLRPPWPRGLGVEDAGLRF